MNSNAEQAFLSYMV